MAQTSLFSDLNNVLTYPLHDCGRFLFADKFGFTNDELSSFVDAYNITGKMKTDRIAVMELHYDGYQAFGSGQSVRLYNPWSVLQSLLAGQYGEYWSQTGGAGHYIMSNVFVKLKNGNRQIFIDNVLTLMSRFHISDFTTADGTAVDLGSVSLDERLKNDQQYNAVVGKSKATLKTPGMSVFYPPRLEMLFKDLGQDDTKNIAPVPADLISYLYYAGYLVGVPLRKAPKEEIEMMQYYIPNRDVFASWKCWIQASMDKWKPELNAGVVTCVSSMFKKDMQAFAIEMAQQLSGLALGFKSYEKDFHRALFFLLQAAMPDNYQAFAQLNSGAGYPDIIVYPRAWWKNDACNQAYVIEMKHTPTESSVPIESLSKQLAHDVEEGFQQIRGTAYMNCLLKEKYVRTVFAISIACSTRKNIVVTEEWVSNKNHTSFELVPGGRISSELDWTEESLIDNRIPIPAMMESGTGDSQAAISEPVPQQAATSKRGKSTVDDRPSYSDETTIETLVEEVCRDFKRTHEASAWLVALKSMGANDVADLRALENEDWAAVCLSIMAKRRLKKAILSDPKSVSKKRKT